MNKNNNLKPEDYLEPNCVLCDKPIGTKPKQESIPQQRISIKLDELMGKKEFNNAEILLKNWLNEAITYNDKQGEFFIYNEMMGYYRKVKRQLEAYEVVDKALKMMPELNYLDSISGATAYTNGATVYTAFEDYEKALILFDKAKIIYENNIEANEYKLAGLYNNMSTCLTSLKRYDEANDLYFKAITLLKSIDGGELELAMIYLNIIDIYLSKDELLENSDKIDEYLNIAKDYLESDNLERNTYYSFMADKCVNIYEYFGWFKYAKILRNRIEEIDERARIS